MKKWSIVLLLFAATLLQLQSCRKTGQDKKAITPETIALIEAKGYSAEGLVRYKDGYVVEGDIFLTDASLAASPGISPIRRGLSEQYRWANLVTGLPRTINVYSALTGVYSTAVNDAIARYNALNLRITFQRVASGAGSHITVVIGALPNGLGGLSGPPSAGNPFNSITLDNNNLGANPPLSFLTTIVAHEMGHCIGMLHTDWQDRTLSCGQGAESSDGSPYNHIPGTPTGNDLNSWMWACNFNQANRPFTCNDATALRTLYGSLYTLTQNGSCTAGSQSSSFTIGGRSGDVVVAELTMTGNARWSGASVGAGGSISIACNGQQALGSNNPLVTNTSTAVAYTVTRSITFTMTAATATILTSASQVNSNINNSTTVTLTIKTVNGANANCLSRPACWNIRTGAL